MFRRDEEEGRGKKEGARKEDENGGQGGREKLWKEERGWGDVEEDEGKKTEKHTIFCFRRNALSVMGT